MEQWIITHESECMTCMIIFCIIVFACMITEMDKVEQARQNFMCGKISADDYIAIREIEYANIVDIDYIKGLHIMEEKSVKAAEDYYAGKISKEEYNRIQQEYYNY